MKPSYKYIIVITNLYGNILFCKATQTKLAAGIPVRYLNKMLEAKHRRLIGQTPKQVM